MEADRAVLLAGSEPDYHVKDLYNAIENGDYPTWSVYVQVMTPEQAKETSIDIFDDTFVWPHKDYPLRLVGRMTLNKNVCTQGRRICMQSTNYVQPDNYFHDIEQACFSPSNMVPGVGPSADPVLQARMFSYPDAQRYRVGANYFQLPPNRPINKVYAPYVRDGLGLVDGNYGGDPNYVTSELHPTRLSQRVQVPNHEQWSGQVTAFSTSVTDKDFEQPRELWHIICKEPKGKEQFLHNIVPTLASLPPTLQSEVLGMCLLMFLKSYSY